MREQITSSNAPLKHNWVVWMGATVVALVSMGAHAEEVCRVADPTHTPLNVRSTPDGQPVGTLSNGEQVTALDHSQHRGKDWVFVGKAADRTPIGWVFQDYLDCRVRNETVESLQPSPDAKAACFVRLYDRTHLAEHPDQLVTGVTLALDPGGPVAQASRTNKSRTKVPFDFKMAVTKRGDNNLYVQEGFVEESNGQYRGVVECDGGGFTLSRTGSGVLLSIGLGAGYKQSMRMAIIPDPCGESDKVDNSTEIEPGKDDRTFRLDVVPDRVCHQLFDKLDWDAVGRQNR